MSAAALVALAAAFNLMCSGTETSGMSNDPKTKTKRPFTEIYRVDLNSRRWCQGACNNTSALVEVSEERIGFEAFRVEEAGVSTHSFANRESGHYGYLSIVGRFSVYRAGKCERRPFTGFPARKF